MINQLEMVENGKKLKITANTAVAATWGFNYYLKYFCNSTVNWSGKNINLNKNDLPIVPFKIQVTARDYIRFYQNVCTYSYSYVWWEFDRWESEIGMTYSIFFNYQKIIKIFDSHLFLIDWMALNGINLVYAQTAAEFPWIKVLY
jgi:alpha-N-acetylglucosaminidase